MTTWPVVSLGEVAKVQIGPFGSLLHKDDYIDGGIPLVNPMHIQDGRIVADTRHAIRPVKQRELANYRLVAGDVVVGRRGEMGRCAVVRPENDGFLCGTGSLFLRPDPNLVSAEYLRRLLSSPLMTARLNRESLGTTMPNLNRGIVANLRISLPPLSEQRRIAAILDHADALRAKRRQTFVELEDLSQSVFLEMFGNPVRDKNRWTRAYFGDVCDSRLGKMLDQKQQTGEHPRPYLRNANVRWFGFDLTDVLEMDFDERSRQLLRLETGDVLVCEGGEPGRAAIWTGQLVECYYQKALHRVRPNREVLHPEFLVRLLWFLSKGGGLNDHVTSVTIAHLTGAKLKAMEIPLPPISLQHSFVRRIEGIADLANNYRMASDELDRLFASLQSRAFRGEL